jgi:RNA methyltransferase, TrmH family
VITSRDNQAVKWIRGLQRSRKQRCEDKVFVVEGPKLLEEALLCGSTFQQVLVTENALQRDAHLLAQLPDTVPVIPVSEPVLASCSDAVSPQGLLAVLSRPAASIPSEITFVLLLDHIQDPGNLGTLLRTARAAGVQVVLLTEGTVDPFNPKVVRAGMGAQLALPIIEEPAWTLDFLAGVKVLLADASAWTDYDVVDWSLPSALVLGNESHGVSTDLEALADGRVRIPMPGGAESLNAAAAGAVLMFEIVRQRKQV